MFPSVGLNWISIFGDQRCKNGKKALENFDPKDLFAVVDTPGG